MIVRAITLAGGLAVGAGTSQFPEFSQQYAQRLGGAVDALSEVVADFDTSAAVEGLSRSEALEQMIGADFIERRRADMERTFDRHAVLTEDLRLLAEAGPFMRAYHAARFTDGDVASAAWDVFEPAVPLNLTSAIFAGFSLA
jgi:diphthamide biosynthesis methyltransferase